MSAKLQQIVIVLKRDGQSTPWGIRLVGGNDLDTPLIITRVQVNSPASDKILRGDVIAKVGEYDARDLSHADAQTLFRTAGNEIRIVVHRDNKIARNQGLSVDSNSRPNSALFSASPNSSVHNRTPSPYGNVSSPYERNLDMPFETLPQTFFPKLTTPGGCVSPPLTSRTEGGTTGGRFSPLSTHRYRLQQELAEEQAIIINQPYRTTPLVLPGAKVKKDAPTTESYLRHYPNPAVRAPPGHDYHDTIMKQRVADTMLHKVVGPEADSGRVFHKQFNSPIGLYSENNIESTIRQTVPTKQPVMKSILNRPKPTKLDGYKKTISFDPSKSETFKAIQEEGYTNSDIVKEVMIPVQPKTFQPNKMVPGKKSLSSAAPVSRPPYNVVNTRDETIRQSGSFNRLMYSVLGASEY